ncbi:MAG: biotin/lipoyl-binding protein [Alphaproteobacteria bacterium]
MEPGKAGKKEQALPRLRQDLQLNPGPADEDGAPTWTLYDPAANKYYKIGWLEFECIARLDECLTVPELVRRVSAETTLRPDEDQLKGLVLFLMMNNLIMAADPVVSEYITEQSDKRKPVFWKKAVHGYLYFTIPLFKPQRFLDATFPYISFLFTRQFMTGVLLLLGAGIIMTLGRIDEFFATFMSYMTGEGMVMILITVTIMKFVHELGHAYTATKYGVPVPVMGVAMMVLYPVLYTETSNAWRMQNRRHRMHISMAGVMAEMVVASVALILWHVLPPGMGRSVAFMLAAVSLISSLLVNLNPLMRFDGYYLVGDLMGIDNLQDRTTAFAKWRIRKILWGWDDAPPEMASPQRARFLETFGFALIGYRFVLYVGIALMVYHLFFKPLGLILTIIEVGFFLALPVLRELAVWWKERKRIYSSPRGAIVAMLLVFGSVYCFLPAQSHIDVPAVLHAQAYNRLYPTVAGQLEEIAVRQGQKVEQGDLLFRISSPSLENEIALAQIKLDAMRQIRGREEADAKLVRKWRTMDEDVAASEQALKGLLEQKERLTVRAAYAGVIHDLDQALHVGDWINTTYMLAVLVDDTAPVLSGYVAEGDHARVAPGAAGWFYPETTPFARYPVKLDQVGDTDSTDIFWPELASVFGGPLPADMNRSQGQAPVSRYTLYSARFVLGDSAALLPDFTLRGVVRLEAAPESLLNILTKRAISVFMQESGL